MTPKRKLLVVEWDDHASHGDDWHSPKTLSLTACQNVSVGWLIAETPKTLTIAHNFADAGDPNEQFCGAMTILKRVITGKKVVG